MNEVGGFTIAGLTLIITGFSWFFIDLYLYLKDKETISVKLNAWAKEMMAIVFIIGFLCGHWFF